VIDYTYNMIISRRSKMRYTVSKLAKISGISVRSLHYYDEIGLLKPAFINDNGYRYYEEAQLLLLQQILFFRELGFPLNDIQKLLLADDFDQIKALNAHKKILAGKIDRSKILMATIDKTLLHLRGKKTMSDKELYYGFDSQRQKEYEQYLVKAQGSTAEELIFESKKRTAKWDKDEWDDVKAQGDEIHKALAIAIDKGLQAKSDEVQIIIHRHYQMIQRFYDPSKEVYIGLTELYNEHPDFKKFFDAYHPKMIEFISKAMIFYADKNL